MNKCMQQKMLKRHEEGMDNAYIPTPELIIQTSFRMFEASKLLVILELRKQTTPSLQQAEVFV